MESKIIELQEQLNDLTQKHNELCSLLQDMNLNPLANFNDLEVEENNYNESEEFNPEEIQEELKPKPNNIKVM